MGTIIDAYAERKKQEVMQDTWGHLAPEPGRSYKGRMLYAHGAYGDMVLLDAEFEDLNDSPWLWKAMQDFIGEDETCGLYIWKGHFKLFHNGKYRFKGKMERLSFDTF